ncbi:DUF6256 family protein [Streptomyces sp. XD-27]|uniref:DUF6256 family protein n=1 Tax=Streptomyces sp. XD-27 TaxID=3062779 RepID=UPI0026F4378D|nr:DUF6256 family protein [Streptomyces sp. XD-27]WKX69125.1 hypothetical protein Q3Y56_03605 [Streptomyces sp. XD-27]
MLPTPTNIAVMLAGYLLIMGYLAVGLSVLRRHPVRNGRGTGAGGRGAGRVPVEPRRRGWPGLVRQVLGTAVGGYLLLMVVVVGYYYGVARVAGHFLASAFTGSALMAGIALPVFLIASWASERRRSRRGRRAQPPTSGRRRA